MNDQVLRRAVRKSLALAGIRSMIELVAEDGIVILAGLVVDYPEKLRIELAAKRTYGVRAIVSCLTTPFDAGSAIPGAEGLRIARAALNNLAQVVGKECALLLSVERGRLAVSGRVDGHSVRISVSEALGRTGGMTRLENHTIVEQTPRQAILRVA